MPRVKPHGGFALVVLVVLALSGCGGSDDGKRDADQNPPVSPSTSSKAALPKTSVCEDKEGDGGAVDLLSASIRNQDDEVLLSAELAGPVPQTGDVWVGFHVQSADFQIIRQVAMRWTDGRMVKPYVYEDSTRKRANLRLSPSDVAVDGNTVTMTVPESLVGDLRPGRSGWFAFTDWTGQADRKSDGCPGQGMRRQPF